MTHFMPEADRALHLLNELQSVSSQFGGEVKVRACDDTAGNVNTWPGTSGGVSRLFEVVTESSVQSLICQLHSSELNLQHVLLNLDCTTCEL